MARHLKIVSATLLAMAGGHWASTEQESGNSGQRGEARGEPEQAGHHCGNTQCPSFKGECGDRTGEGVLRNWSVERSALGAHL